MARIEPTRRQLRDLGSFRESDAFSADEKLVLEYAEAMSQGYCKDGASALPDRPAEATAPV